MGPSTGCSARRIIQDPRSVFGKVQRLCLSAPVPCLLLCAPGAASSGLTESLLDRLECSLLFLWPACCAPLPQLRSQESAQPAWQTLCTKYAESSWSNPICVRCSDKTCSRNPSRFRALTAPLTALCPIPACFPQISQLRTAQSWWPACFTPTRLPAALSPFGLLGSCSPAAAAR